MKAACPDEFESRKVVADAESLAQRTFVDEDDEKVVYIRRFKPDSWDEDAEYSEAGAVAYELYVICSDQGVIEEVNHRGEPCPCGGRSIIPHGAPAFIFPQGAMFDVEWDEVAPCAQAEMLLFLEKLVGAGDKAPKTEAKRKRPASKKPRTVPARKRAARR